MQAYLGALTIILLFGMVLSRVLMMKRQGLQAMQFGKIDKTDFLIPPVALVYFYSVFAHAFGLPQISTQTFFQSELVAWLGVFFCLIGLLLLLWSLLSFGRSFRIGIDIEQAGQLVTTGIFDYSRNPIYVAFALILFGQFLIFPNWILLVYLGAAIWLFHRQVLREEDYLKIHYGDDYNAYCDQVRRYL
jgi:protein-S-isoprenylcysteine O-methyltransferase Ste14